MRKLIVFLLAATLILMQLAACSMPSREPTEPAAAQEAVTPESTSAQTPEQTPEPTPEPTRSPTPEPTRSPTPGPEPTPLPVRLQVLMTPGGGWVNRYAEQLDLSNLEHEQLEKAMALISQMPNLRTVDLGADRATAAGGVVEAEDPPVRERLSWQDIRLLQKSFPQIDFVYRFRFCGRSFTTMDEVMDLNHRTMDDEGAAVREILPCMTRCTFLDMDFCGVSDEAMAAIRDDFPQIEVVWRIWFGRDNRLSVRTNTERILASDGGFHLEYNVEPLKYCTKVKYLDVGHMPDLHDWSFLAYMPELEVCIISIGGWEGDDLSGLANCPHLEFLEMCSRSTTGEIDLSFLANLTELKHLNICCLYDNVVGYEALENLTQLERLWIGKNTYIPEEYIEHLRQVLPNTEINTTSETGDGGAWRFTAGSQSNPQPRYALLCQQFEYGNYDHVCSLYYNDPLYWPHD